jgi:hypothetical protein
MEMEMRMDGTVPENDANLLLKLAEAAPAAAPATALPSKRLRVSERAPPTVPPECFSGGAGVCYERYVLNEMAEQFRSDAFVIPSCEINRSEDFRKFVFSNDPIEAGTNTDTYLCRLFRAMDQQVQGGGTCPYTSARNTDTLSEGCNSNTCEGCDAILVSRRHVLGNGCRNWSLARRQLMICEVKYGGVDGKGVTTERLGPTMALWIQLKQSGVERRFCLITSAKPTAGVLNSQAFFRIYKMPAPPEVNRLAQLYKDCSVTKAQLYDVANYCISQLGVCEETLPVQRVVNKRLCSFHDKRAEYSRQWNAMRKTAVPL